MSDEQQHDDAGPRPEPIRFFGTTWVDRDGGYGLRRAAVALGSLVAAAAGAFVLRFAYQGIAVASGAVVRLLFVLALAICTALAFRRTWEGFGRRTDAPAEGRSLMLIGFVGSLLAYFVRSLTEAPGERLRRAEYQAALERHERTKRGRR